MHVPDGFLDARPRRRRRSSLPVPWRGRCAEPAGSSTTGSRRWPASSRCCVLPRGWSLPRGGRDVRPLAGRRPRGGARRAADRGRLPPVVVTVQALLFADGGVSALGTDACSWRSSALGRLRRLRRHPLGPAPQLGAVSRGGGRGRRRVRSSRRVRVRRPVRGGSTAPIPLAALAMAIGTWHLVIGLGEAAITFLVVPACWPPARTWSRSPAGAGGTRLVVRTGVASWPPDRHPLHRRRRRHRVARRRRRALAWRRRPDGLPQSRRRSASPTVP